MPEARSSSIKASETMREPSALNVSKTVSFWQNQDGFLRAIS
jgi:hypothetical protein